MENWKASMVSQGGVKWEGQGKVVYSLLFARTNSERDEHFKKKVGHLRSYKHLERKTETDFYSKLGHMERQENVQGDRVKGDRRKYTTGFPR